MPLTYTVSDSAEAALPLARIANFHTTAKCTGGASEVDTETQVGLVKTNTSAIIP